MKKIVIFGAGYHGRMAYRKLKEKKFQKEILFVDNGVIKKPKTFFREKIYNPRILLKESFDNIILCGRYIKQQKKQLQDYGIKKNLIYWGRRDLKPKKEILSQRTKKYMIILKDIFDKFENNNINFWADYSGLLPLKRKQNIAEMSDFDICINAEDSSKIIKLVKKSKLYNVEVKYNFYSKIKKKKFPKIAIYGKCNFNKMEPPTIDFIPRVFYENKNEELKVEKNIIQNSEPWSGHEKIKYNKLNIRIPKNSDKYLKKLYGKRWYIEENFWFRKKR